MLNHFLLTFLIILSITNNCAASMTKKKQSIILSLNQKLNVKHFSIIKDSDFQIDLKIFNFAKTISREKFFISFMSAFEMNVSMNEYYKTPPEYYLLEYRQKYGEVEYKKRANWVYPPKTIVMPYGENVEGIIDQLFTGRNKFAISKYIWLFFTDRNGLLIDPEIDYIPYNCQFLIVDTFSDAKGNHNMGEIYHPSLQSPGFFHRHIGYWNQNTGVEIFQPDFYQRRFDMKNTTLIALTETILQKETKVNVRWNIEIADIISRMMNFRWIFKPRHLNTGDNYERWELHLFFMGFGNNYIPHYIGPLWKETYHFYLAYNKKYEQHSTSPLLKPFSSNLWLTMLGWLFISIIIILIILKTTLKTLKTESDITISMPDCLYEPLDSIFNQYGGNIPKKSSFRIASMANRTLALILSPIYIGAVASFILFPSIKLPFTNPKEFVQDGSYNLGVVKSMKLREELNLTKDPWLQKISQTFLVHLNGSVHEAVNEGLKRMCNDYKFVFLDLSDEYADGRFGCKAFKINSPVFFNWAIMSLNYESPYLTIFNRIVKSIRSNGILNYIVSMNRNKLGAEKFSIIEPKNIENDEVNLINLIPIFNLIAVLYVFSMIIIFAEIIYFKIK